MFIDVKQSLYIQQATGKENERGKIAAGFDADFTICNDDSSSNRIRSAVKNKSYDDCC
jgi:predicted amidohydrolase YtcJ